MDQVDRFFDEKWGRLWDEAKNGMKFEDDVANEKLDTWKLSSPLFPIFLGRRLPVSRVRNIVAKHLLLDSKKRSTHILQNLTTKEKEKIRKIGRDINITFSTKIVQITQYQRLITITSDNLYTSCNKVSSLLILRDGGHAGRVKATHHIFDPKLIQFSLSN